MQVKIPEDVGCIAERCMSQAMMYQIPYTIATNIATHLALI